MIRLYEYFRSSTSHRSRIALNLKGVDYESVSVHLVKNGGEQKAPDYLKNNPQGLVPTLEEDGFNVGQSLAIIEWLDERFPEPPFLPSDINQKAKIRAFAMAIACDIHPLQNLRILRYLEAEFNAGEDARKAWCQRWLGEGLSACEALVAKETHGAEFCFGETPGLAEICLVPQIFSAYRFDVDLSGMPNLMRVFETCQALPAFAKAAPDQHPDAQ